MGVVTKLLRFIALGFSVCAFVAGVGAGLFEASLGGVISCFDTCPEPTNLYPRVVDAAIHLMTPCVALALAALATFVIYCLITRQRRRAIIQVAAFVIIGALGIAVLGAYWWFGQTHPPLTPDGYFKESELELWVTGWGLTLTVVSGVWSGILAYLQWAA
jgi:hypothetical protein